MKVYIPQPVYMPGIGSLQPGEHALDEELARLLIERGLALPVDGQHEEPREAKPRKDRR